MVGEIARGVVLFSAMSQPVKDDAIHPPKLHVMIEEIERLILKVKTTGDHQEERLQTASEPSRSRLVALNTTEVVLFITVERFLPSTFHKANYLRAPDERS